MAVFAHFSIGCERCPFGRDVSSCQAGFRLGTASRTGFAPVRLRFGGHCTASLLISGIVKRSFRNADSGMPRISLRCTEQRSGHGPQVEVAKQTHSHTPAHDGDAEITQDLFLTKWSSIPGEFEPILAPTVDFGGDHLLRFKTYLGSKRRAHQG